MFVCGCCLSEVTKFKSGSHVFPRWAIKLTKEDGKNIYLSSDESRTNQKDLIAEAWCEDCESKFTSLDAVGAVFFRDKGDFINADSKEGFDYEYYKTDNYKLINKFLLSLIVRYYLYKKSVNLQVENSKLYSELERIYRKDGEIFFFLYNCSNHLLNTAQLPWAEEKRVVMMINGYLVLTYVELEAEDTPYITNLDGKMLVPIMKPNNAYTQNMAKLTQELKGRK